MADIQFAKDFAKELEAETPSTLKCLERFSMDLFNYKPHERSMEMGYLAVLVAEIPLWVAHIIKENEIDLATFPHLQPKSAEDIVNYFKNNLEKAKEALLSMKQKQFDDKFELKVDGKVVLGGTKKEHIAPTINHMVHHRGQLTVYMRLNNIAVPSIYGPSADEKSF